MGEGAVLCDNSCFHCAESLYRVLPLIIFEDEVIYFFRQDFLEKAQMTGVYAHNGGVGKILFLH